MRWGHLPLAGESGAMSYDNVVGLGLAAALTIYLVAALFFPERF
jgi:K+-transporting ATPase KdpF subunit